MIPAPAPYVDVDPFDLPEALGTDEVTWSSTDGLHGGHLVRGVLTSAGGVALDCDLVAVDDAFPAPVADDALRLRVHQAWRHGQVLLVRYDGRLTILVPGTDFDADLVLTAIGRLAKALGASPFAFAVHLRLGG